MMKFRVSDLRDMRYEIPYQFCVSSHGCKSKIKVTLQNLIFSLLSNNQ